MRNFLTTWWIISYFRQTPLCRINVGVLYLLFSITKSIIRTEIIFISWNIKGTGSNIKSAPDLKVTLNEHAHFCAGRDIHVHHVWRQRTDCTQISKRNTSTENYSSIHYSSDSNKIHFLNNIYNLLHETFSTIVQGVSSNSIVSVSALLGLIFV